MVDLNEYAGQYIGSDELATSLNKLGYEVKQVTIADNNSGYFAIIRARKDGEEEFVAVESFTGSPMCVGKVQLMAQVAGLVDMESLRQLYDVERNLSHLIQQYIESKQYNISQLHDARDALRVAMRKLGWTANF